MATPPTRPTTASPISAPVHSKSQNLASPRTEGATKQTPRNPTKATLDEKQTGDIREKLQNSLLGQDGAHPKWEIPYPEITFGKKLGTGTSGDVYKGEWKGQECAVKVLRASNQTQEIDEFVREFSVMINIKSDCIVQFYGACVNEELCMVMEYCGMGSLYDVLQSPAITFTWPLVLEMMREITTGIKVLHDSTPSLFHRDLKSLNILVTEDLKCRVADFGLSRFVVDENTITLNKCRGTAAYIAPEVFSKRGFIKESDIYSLSMILWELVTRIILGKYERPYGEYPWKQDFQILMNAAKLNKRPTIKEGTPLYLEQFISDTWAVDPDERGDCAAFLKRIARWKEDYEGDKVVWDALVKNLQQ